MADKRKYVCLDFELREEVKVFLSATNKVVVGRHKYQEIDVVVKSTN